jgi:hypothetical protein
MKVLDVLYPSNLLKKSEEKMPKEAANSTATRNSRS